MTSEGGGVSAFAAKHDAPIPCVHRIRNDCEAPGRGAPCEHARYSEVPFSTPTLPE
jgi:hypothetical protein